jgi:imidazolonepropionase-like amidohydrolase
MTRGIEMKSQMNVIADRVFDGEEFKDLPVMIGVCAGAIRSVEPWDGVAPSGDQLVDARGFAVIPGLINTHTHVARGGMFRPDEPISVDSIVRNFRDLLRAGVTTVGEMGCTAGLVYSLRERFSRSPNCGPDIVACGPLLTVEGGYPLDWMPALARTVRAAVPCPDPDAGRRAVRQVVSMGMDHIKLAIMHRSYAEKPIPAMDEATARAIVEEAHACGRKAFCHAHYYEDYDKALNAGVDVLAHSCFEPLDAEMVRRVIDSGVYYCPTLSIFESALAGIEDRWDRDPRYARFVSRRVLRDWTSFCEEYERSGELVPSGIAGGLPKERGREAVVTARENFRLLCEAGAPVVFGTDAQYGFGILGRPVDELAAMQRAGLSPAGCLRAATSTAAGVLQVKDRGSLKPGMRADMVIVAAGVRDDIACVEQVEGVIRAGALLDDSPAREAGRTLLSASAVASGIVRTAGWTLTRR